MHRRDWRDGCDLYTATYHYAIDWRTAISIEANLPLLCRASEIICRWARFRRHQFLFWAWNPRTADLTARLLVTKFQVFTCKRREQRPSIGRLCITWAKVVQLIVNHAPGRSNRIPAIWQRCTTKVSWFSGCLWGIFSMPMWFVHVNCIIFSFGLTSYSARL